MLQNQAHPIYRYILNAVSKLMEKRGKGWERRRTRTTTEKMKMKNKFNKRKVRRKRDYGNEEKDTHYKEDD